MDRKNRGKHGGFRCHFEGFYRDDPSQDRQGLREDGDGERGFADHFPVGMDQEGRVGFQSDPGATMKLDGGVIDVPAFIYAGEEPY